MKDGRGINNDNCADNGKHNDEDKDNKDEDKNQKRHRHPFTSWMRWLVSIKKTLALTKTNYKRKSNTVTKRNTKRQMTTCLPRV